MYENVVKKRKRAGRRRYSRYITQYRPNHYFAHKDGHVLEHRLVWEYYNKAILLPWAHIHHKNMNTSDNRIENLEVRVIHKEQDAQILKKRGIRIRGQLNRQFPHYFNV